MNIDTVVPALGANLIWQTLLLAGVVGLALRILPRYAVGARYQISLVALLGSGLLFAAPFLPDLTPDLSIGIAPQSAPQAVQITETPVTENAARPIGSFNVNQPSPFPLGTLLLTVWMIGIAASLTRLGLAAKTSLTWARHSQKIELTNQAFLSKEIDLRRSAYVPTPLVLGFFRPVVLVPQDFDLNLKNPATRAVLEHEIAHLIRQDLWTNFVQRLILALLWWCVPLYWINAQICIEREKLCDDIAAKKVGAGRVLAAALVDLVDQHPKHQPLLAIGLHPRAHNLAERIHRLCKEHPMPKLSKRLLITTSIAVPALVGSLILAAPRAIAHSPTPPHASSHMDMEDISSLQYALFKATSLGRIDEVREMLAMGIDPAFHIHGDGSPLIIAAKIGHTEIADLLLNHGAQINRMTASDESPLINAVKANNLNMVELLVQRGADVSLGQVSNPRHRPEWRSPLSTAQKYRHTQIAQYLRNHGAVADTRKTAPRRIAPGPIVEGRLTSKFGVIRKNFDKTKHTGVDIANKEGTPIFAPADGTIIEVTDTYKDNAKWGHVVVLETPGGIKTIFAHLKDSQVSQGDFVRQGTQIARLGNTGKSTGPHVHIQTRKNGKLIDPLKAWPTLAR
ncbi:MAG: hypothetical protein EX271_00270 [Acidimicrobiales bacterium]|nr:peptidoglycan DD-metalloendopeptidase family protein [Hyphomonadaceae bacterium]RZV45017.1 MAG: hypothetical protein EX271_00270 [Acidimicrobiales bacterium]